MKRTINRFLCTTVAAALTLTAAFTVPVQAVGVLDATETDVSRDGIVAADDASQVLEKVLNSSYQFTDNTKSGDVNSDGILTADDASMILQKVLDNSYTGSEKKLSGQSIYIKPVLADNDESLTLNDDEFVVNLDVSNVENTTGISSYTFFVTYDPNVVQLTGVASATDKSTYATYKSINDETGKTEDKTFFSITKIKGQITLVPTADDTDYKDVSADGVKTCAELGKVKIADIITASDVNDSTKIASVDNSGTLFALKFKTVGVGDSKIAIDLNPDLVDGLNPTPKAATAYTTVALDGNITVSNDVSMQNYSLNADTVDGTYTTLQFNNIAATTADNIQLDSTGRISFTVGRNCYMTVAPEVWGVVVSSENGSINGDSSYTIDKGTHTVLLTPGDYTITGGSSRYKSKLSYILFENADTPVITVSNSNGEANRNVTVPVSISGNNKGITDFSIDVSFDADMLEFVNVDSAVSGLNVTAQSIDSGLVTINGTADTALTTNGTLFNLTFKANKNAKAYTTSEIKADVYSLNNGDIPVTATGVSGTFTTDEKTYIQGDMNDDGVVDMLDVIALLKLVSQK
jgi:hypothetical protein